LRAARAERRARCGAIGSRGEDSVSSISVVIPLYNKQEYVEQAVRSALQSSCLPHEVIVVDDGSTDNGPQRVRAIADPRVRLISQPNRGVSAARNRGIDEARGEYIAFLDADDYWTPRYLGAIAELIARFPGCGMYATHFYYFRGDGFRKVPRLPGVKCGAQRIERFFELWSHGLLFIPSAVVIPRRLLGPAGVRYPEGEQRGEDQDVWFRLAERWPVAYLPEPLIGYRFGVPGSLMDSLNDEDWLPYIQRLAARYRAHAIPAAHCKGVLRLLRVNRLDIAQHLLRKGERRRAMRLLYDPAGLCSPRYWARLFVAAHVPAWLGQYFLP
jgi:glycosyltransferase involved in cell wall biosynthesis